MKNKAFTLIELLVVITIIGILSGIVIVAIGDAVDRARIAGSQRFSHSIRTRLALDMVGRWPLDNNTVDHSGWNNHGTLVTGTAPTPDPCAVRYPTGVTGQALCFDGVDDFVEAPHHSSLNLTNNFTIELWFRPARLDQFQTYLLNKRESRYAIIYEYVNNQIEFFAVGHTGSDPRVGSQIPITTIDWHHIVYSYNGNGTNWEGYRNGVQVFSHIRTFSLALSTLPLMIGAATPTLNFTHGLIDEVRIFRAAVPASYIQKRYVEGVKSLAANSGISQEEKQQKIAELRNSGQLVIDLDAALTGPIDFSPYAHYFEALSLEVTE